MIIEIEEAKYKLNNFRADLKELGSALRIDDLKNEVRQIADRESSPARKVPFFDRASPHEESITHGGQTPWPGFQLCIEKDRSRRIGL